MSPPVIVDLDDLWCEEQIEEHLVPLAEAVPGFKVTCYTIPNKFGPVTKELRDRYPWMTWGIHGWEHTNSECLEWTEEKATELLGQALDMGYDKLFKPPNWQFDGHVLEACFELDIVFHHAPRDRNHEGLKGLDVYPGRARKRILTLHSHIEETPGADWIGAHPGFAIENLKTFSEFLTPLDAIYRVPEDETGGDPPQRYA